MNLREKISYRDAMEEMAKYHPCLFNHYLDEYYRMDGEIQNAWHDMIVMHTDKIIKERGLNV